MHSSWPVLPGARPGVGGLQWEAPPSGASPRGGGCWRGRLGEPTPPGVQAWALPIRSAPRGWSEGAGAGVAG